MKLVYPLSLLFMGIALTFFGALFKLESWEGASEMLIFGTISTVAGIGLLIYRAIRLNDKA
ncbi:MAG: hypothetical protein J0M29_06325 [Chitinophagales bacterium]|nr:hypothetical protein [Chitinophagales bacterium]